MMYDFYTYDRGRQCKYCAEPIADQAHGLQEYCEREVLDDGSVKSCKDDHNSQLRKLSEEPYLQLTSFHKRTTGALASLYSSVGEKVTLQQLNQYGIQLNRAVETRITNGLPTFFFIHFRIDQLTPTTFKLTRHVYPF